MTGRLLPSCAVSVLLLTMGAGEHPKTRGWQGQRRQKGEDPALVEGCFNNFNAFLNVSLGRESISNLRCRDLCSDRGFALAATAAGGRCLCGNDYPSEFHRVEAQQCDNPCSVDQGDCFLHTCCGSRNGSFLTVSFSRETEVTLQLLRRLSFSFRESSPTFRHKIERELADTAALQLVTAEGDGQPPHYLGMSDGCPPGWRAWGSSCYQQHWATPLPYAQAQGVCRGQGAEVVSIESRAENDEVRRMHAGCRGWIGLVRGQGGEWRPDGFRPLITAKSMVGGGGEVPERDEVVITVLGAKEGARSCAPGGAFRDGRLGAGGEGLVGLRVGYTAEALWSLEGRDQSGASVGARTGLRPPATRLQWADISLPAVEAVSAILRGPRGPIRQLHFRLRPDASSPPMPPLGDPRPLDTGQGEVAQEFTPGYGPLVGAAWTVGARGLRCLALGERAVEDCTLMGADGGWRHVSCGLHLARHPDTILACERPLVACEAGWEVVGGGCYRRVSAAALGGNASWSWAGVRARCRGLGGKVVTISSQKTNELVRDFLVPHGGLIGLGRDADGGEWEWDMYEHAARAQATGQPRCYVMERDSVSWRPVGCRDKVARHAVCELEGGTSCTCPHTSWRAFQCSCYQRAVSRDGLMSWVEAQQACAALGRGVGLVSISSSAEEGLVQDVLADAPAAFIGLNDLLHPGRLQWDNVAMEAGGGGAGVTSMAAAVGGGPGGGDCAVMGPDGAWVPTPCDAGAPGRTAAGVGPDCLVCEQPKTVPSAVLQAQVRHFRGQCSP
jgi:hypothetical protein